jgi:secreted trypsin-like serine protease
MKLRRLQKIITVSFFSLSLIVSGNSPAQAIVSGAYVINPPSESPWAISLWVDQDNDEGPTFICSGTLISSQLILTAAHCFQGIQGEFFVEVGATTLGTGKKIGVDSYWVSPRYNRSNIVNDVAVGHLLLPHELRVYPRLDKSSSTGSSTKAKATIFGWGRDQNGEITGDLRKTTVSFQKVSALKSYGRGFNTKTNLAAGTYIAKERIYTAACNGDSGGPLMTGTLSNPVISGIVSYGPAESCNLTIPTVFSRVSYYLGDIATAKNFVAARSQTNNLAAPVSLESPVVSGTLTPGSTVTCSDGVWTSNAKSYKKSWFSNPRGAKDYEDAEKLGEGDSLVLSRDMFSKTLLCYVQATGSKRTGGKVVEVALTDLALSASFSSPSDGSSVAGKFTLKGTTLASSNGSSSISKICLKMNGKVPSSGFYVGSYSFSNYADNEGCISTSSTTPYWEFDATNWANGSYSFTMIAHDSSGQKSVPVSTTLTISNSDPAATFISPADGSVIFGKFTLRGTAAASPGGTATVSKVCLKLNGKVPSSGFYVGSYSFSNYADNEGCISTSSTDPYWEFDATTWANGTYSFAYYLVDSSGRKSNSVSRTFSVANENPTATILSPAEGSVNAGRFTLRGTAAVSPGGTATVSKVCLKLNGKVPSSGFYVGSYSFSNYADNEGCISTSSTTPYWEFDSTTWTNGTYSFTYNMYDSSGRVSNTAFRTLTISNANPIVNLTSPADGSTISGRFTLSGTATPSEFGTASINRVCLKLNGSVPSSGFYVGSYSFSNYADNEGCISTSSTTPYWEFDATNWAAGNYTFAFYSLDSSGRQSDTVTRTLRKG